MRGISILHSSPGRAWQRWEEHVRHWAPTFEIFATSASHLAARCTHSGSRAHNSFRFLFAVCAMNAAGAKPATRNASAKSWPAGEAKLFCCFASIAHEAVSPASGWRPMALSTGRGR